MAVVAMSACAGHLHSLPQVGAANALAARGVQGLQGRSNERTLYAHVESAGRTPDGSYQIRTIHLVGVKAHEVSSYVTPNGTFTQQEYSTPFGLLTVMQTELRQAPPVIANAPQSSTARNHVRVHTLGEGTTSHGGMWLVTEGLKPRSDHVHLQFDDSMFDADVPSSIDLQTLRTLLESVY